MSETSRPIEWSEQARLDLLDVVTYLLGERPESAARFLDILDERLAQVARFPSSGRPVPEDIAHEGDDEAHTREVLVLSWRVGYRVRDSVLVLYVIHGARLFPPQR